MDGTAGRLNEAPSLAAQVAAGQPVRVHDFASWRAAARELLAARVPPHAVQWLMADQAGDLLTGEGGAAPMMAPAQDLFSASADASVAPAAADVPAAPTTNLPAGAA